MLLSSNFIKGRQNHHFAGPPALAKRICHILFAGLSSDPLLRSLDHKHGNLDASFGLAASIVRARLDISEKFLP
jgi:hypothetical protein